MAEIDVEQPDASSASEEVVEQELEVTQEAAPEPAPEVEEEAPLPPPPRGSTREPSRAAKRIGELVNERNAERQARAELERRLQALEYERQLQEQSVPQRTGYEGDPLYEEVRAQRALLEQMRRETQYARDARQREEFWSEHDYVSEDVVEEVETTVSEFRAKGLDKINRQDILHYVVGKREAPKLREKVKRPAPTPPVNRVAVVEGAPSKVSVPSKRLEDMSREDLEALPLEKLRELMKDRTF